MKTIIVFGATGKIGAYFVDECVRRLAGTDYEVVAVGRKNTSFFTERGVAYYQVDIKKAADFDRLPQENVYAVVNFAGLLPAYSQSITPFDYIDTNVTGGVRILEYARKVKANRVLYSQSWAEVTSYLKEGCVLLSPDMPRKLTYTGDHAFYSICKSMIVESMEYYHQEYGIKNFVFRLPNIYLYGPQKSYYVDGKERVIAYRYMIGRAIAGENIELWGNPDAFRDIVYVKDCCQMFYKALFAQTDGGLYHVGTGQRTTLREQIEGMIRVFSPPNHPSKIIPRPDKDSISCFVMDIENARRDLGYKPEYDYLSYLRDYKREMEQKRFDALFQLP